MVHLHIDGQQFVNKNVVDNFISWMEYLAYTSHENIEIVEVLENDNGDVIFILDCDGKDVLVHNIVYRAAYTTPYFSFPDGLMTYAIVSEEDFSKPIFFGSFVTTEEVEESDCGCPPGICLAEDSDFLPET